jgi:hypothetical protein
MPQSLIPNHCSCPPAQAQSEPAVRGDASESAVPHRSPSRDEGLLHALLAGLVVGMVNVFQPCFRPEWETEICSDQLVDDPYENGAGFDYQPPPDTADDT